MAPQKNAFRIFYVGDVNFLLLYPDSKHPSSVCEAVSLLSNRVCTRVLL